MIVCWLLNVPAIGIDEADFGLSFSLVWALGVDLPVKQSFEVSVRACTPSTTTAQETGQAREGERCQFAVPSSLINPRHFCRRLGGLRHFSRGHRIVVFSSCFLSFLSRIGLVPALRLFERKTQCGSKRLE